MNATYLNVLAEEVYKIAASKGFHDRDVDNYARVAEYIANLHGEVSELWEAHRRSALFHECDKVSKMRDAGTPIMTCIEEELADIIIRALDMAHGMNVDIGRAVEAKSAFNMTRQTMHGKIC